MEEILNFVSWIMSPGEVSRGLYKRNWDKLSLRPVLGGKKGLKMSFLGREGVYPGGI